MTEQTRFQAGGIFRKAAMLLSATALLPWAAAAQRPTDGSPAKPRETGAAASRQAPRDGMQEMPCIQAKQVRTASGKEDWSAVAGFGKDAGMVEMMTLMMVGGSGMEHMKGMKMGGAGMAGMKMPGMNMADKGRPGMQPTGLPIAVTLATNPPAVGANTLDVVVTDASGKPVTGLKLMASVAMTSMDMGTTKPRVTEGQDGHYAVTVTFSMKGPWRVDLMSDPRVGTRAGGVHATLDFNIGGKEKWSLPKK